jgi:hypothetical protein
MDGVGHSDFAFDAVAFHPAGEVYCVTPDIVDKFLMAIPLATTGPVLMPTHMVRVMAQPHTGADHGQRHLRALSAIRN